MAFLPNTDRQQCTIVFSSYREACLQTNNKQKYSEVVITWNILEARSKKLSTFVERHPKIDKCELRQFVT